MRHASSTPGSKHPLRRAALWIGFLSLLLSLIAPIIQLQEISAQGDPPDCDPGYIVDEALNQCVEDPNAQDGQNGQDGQQGDAQQPGCDEGQVYDQSYGGCVPDPNQQEEADPVGVQVEKYDCTGLEFDPYAASFNDLQSACAANGAAVQMTVGSDNGEQSSPTNNYTEWTNLPAGSGYVYEGVPEGYGQPVVFCGVYEPQQSQPSPNQYNVQNGNAIGWQLEPGEYLYCWWFNIAEDDGFGRIDLSKYRCDGYEGDPQTATYDQLADACQDPHANVTFELYYQQALEAQATTGSGGQASFDNVPAGDVAVAEVLPEGYEYGILFCTYHPFESGNNVGPDKVNLTDGYYFGWGMEADYVLDCVWFDFGPPIEAAGTGTNWIDFYKYECAWDTPTGENADYYQQECQAVEGWNFDVQWDGGGSGQTTDNSGLASWEGVPTGSWTGSESVPEGYGQPSVYCRFVDWPDEASYDNNWFPYDPSGGEITYEFDYDNVRIECWWFNFLPEDGDGNWIDFYKYVCAYDTPIDEGVGYYQDNCQPAEGWEFNLQHTGGGGTQTTDGSGYTGWSNVPTGSWQAQETLPEGYADPIVYCRYVEWPEEAGVTGDWAMFDAPGGFYENGFGYEGMRIECYWINFAPEGGGSWIDLYKYTCPAGTAYDTDPSTLASECTLAQDYAFAVNSGAYSQQQVTDQNGFATWFGVPTGGWTMTETLPGGYGDPVVYCRFAEWPEGVADIQDTTFLVEAPGGQWSGDFKYEGMRLVCGVFNMPGEGSWIDFYKYECAVDVQKDQNAEYYQQECAPVEGWNFDVQWDGGGSTQTTDASGLASWSGVPIGTWTGAETLPEGADQPVVWCQYIEWPDEAGYDNDWFAYSPDDASISHDFEYDGVRIVCWWFNFEYQQNWLDVTKWWCAETVTMPYEQSADNLLEECERYTEGVDLTLNWDGGGSATMTTDGEGNAEWGDLPSGPWSLHEDVPDGYGNPVVWCRWIEWPEGENLTNDPFEFEAPNGSFVGGFPGGGYRLHCDIFNIVDYDPGWVTVYKWYCAIGIPTDSSAEYLRDECDLVTTGVDFSLHYGETSAPMTTDTAGKAEWNGVPQGEWSLEETSASSYGEPIVWCQWTDWPPEADASYTQDLYQPEVADARVTGSHEYPGMRLVCYWFNFGYEDGDHEILIYKYWCAPGSGYGEDLDAWLEGCPDTSDGISYTLANESGSYPQATSGGSVEWTGVEGGDFTVQESLPTGYEEPRLWCYRYAYEEGAAPTFASEDFEPFSAPEGLWTGTFEEGSWRIVCYWFNIAGDENTFTVYKYNCEYVPAGFNTLGEWLDACPTKGNDIEFTFDYTGGSESKTTADGMAEWTGVPEGAFTLTEEPYAGYGEPVVWCGWTAYNDGVVYDAFPQEVEVPGGVYQGEYTVPGTTWFCYWFNIPDDDSRITVYKYNCPEDALIENTLDGYQSACTEWGDGIEFTLDNSTGASTKEIAGGSATWNDVPQGEFTLTEEVPFGYGEPVWWCGFSGYQDGAIFDGFAQLVDAPEGVHTGSIDYDVTYYFCWVFNYPDYDREVTVYKWYCPEGLTPESEDWEDWADTCVNPMPGISFNLAHDGGSSWKHTNVGGKASWYGTEPGGHTLREQFLPGYEPPVVYCSLEAFFDDGAAYAEALSPYPVSDNTWSKDLDYAEYKWVCHVYNVPRGPGEITFYKWWCPPGYDVEKWGANPKEECTQAQDGVPYVLDRPVGPNQTQDTGDQIPGGVYFGDLDPGTYVVSEMVPSGTAYVFIWDCTGGDIPKVHPKPLTWGNVLKVDVAGGDSIVCNWYNVPEPENGWLTVYKYQCWTKTYTSDVDCETYEFGAEFELITVDGNASQGTGITSPGGIYTWNNLEAGSYALDEKDGEPCKVVPSKIDETGNPRVDAGQETVVKVYNCESSTTVPGGKTPGGKVPGKYPNTGVGVDPVAAPVAAIQGDDPDEGEDAEAEGTPTDEEAAAEFYEIACLNSEADDPGGRLPATEEPGQAEGGGEDGAPGDLPPFLQPATGEATDQADDDGAEASPTEPASTDESIPEDAAETGECERGAVPERMVIDAANVNHDVEILEIIDGVMQAPTGPNVVSWYKETARLGEESNIVVAAHVNWWNVPEGPFYHLQDLVEGDRVEITGEDGLTYVYEVQWVRQESNLEAPNAEVVGPTGEKSLTLITCGGEWDASISEYNERTVARAVQVEVIAPDAPDTAQAAGTYRLAA